VEWKSRTSGVIQDEQQKQEHTIPGRNGNHLLDMVIEIPASSREDSYPRNNSVHSIPYEQVPKETSSFRPLLDMIIEMPVTVPSSKAKCDTKDPISFIVEGMGSAEC
jgi:hypothetical protein